MRTDTGGTDLFTVKKPLGHTDHGLPVIPVGAENLRSAVNTLSKPRQAEVLSVHDREGMEHAVS